MGVVQHPEHVHNQNRTKARYTITSGGHLAYLLKRSKSYVTCIVISGSTSQSYAVYGPLLGVIAYPMEHVGQIPSGGLLIRKVLCKADNMPRNLSGWWSRSCAHGSLPLRSTSPCSLYRCQYLNVLPCRVASDETFLPGLRLNAARLE